MVYKMFIQQWPELVVSYHWMNACHILNKSILMFKKSQMALTKNIIIL